MPGRKQPREREEDRDREYRMQQKRGYGEDAVGEDAADDVAPDVAKLPQAGAQVEREREEYAQRKDLLSRQDL